MTDAKKMLLLVATALFVLPAPPASSNLRGAAALAQRGHGDKRLLPKGCASCHRNHAAESVLFNKKGADFCLQCHGSAGAQQRAKEEKRLAVFAGALSDIEREFQKPFVHPLGKEAAREGCLLCHAVHPKKADNRLAPMPSGPDRVNDLCLDCHEEVFPPDKIPASFHVRAGAGGALSCGDCHGSDEPSGPAGVHGSREKGLLRDSYVSEDGARESEENYALCYRCHDREDILGGAGVARHALHVSERGIGCSACHTPHASALPDLICFKPNLVFPLDGRVEYIPAAGCVLVCHGVAHAPLMPAPPVVRPPTVEKLKIRATP